MDLYAEELKVWKECRGFREDRESEEKRKEEEEKQELGQEEQKKCKVPGAFEW